MQNQQYLIQQLEKDISTLLESPPSYMRQITKISQKIVSLETKFIFFVINKIRQIIQDPNQTIKKKLFAFRFIKDCMLLASHSFYILTVIRILPFMVQVLTQGNRQADNGLQFLIKLIGPKPQVSNAIEIKTFSTTLLQLINQIVKWAGTHIKLHPCYKIPFSSVFKMYLQSLPKVKSIKITDLTYFTTDSINIYEQNSLQAQLNSENQNKKQVRFIELLINNWISLPQDDQEKKNSLILLQNVIETGDSLFIRHTIDCLKPLIESQITGYQAIQIVNELFKVRQIEFCILARDQLLYSIAYYVLMMSKEKFSKLQNIDFLEILRQVFVWKIYFVKLGIKTQIFDEFFNKMKNQWIVGNQSEYTSKTGSIQQQFEKFKYFLSSTIFSNITSEKKNQINLKDDVNAINKIRWLEYKKREFESKKNSFFPDKPDNFSNESLKIQKQIRNNQFAKGNSFGDVLKQENLSLQQLENQSPIKQLQMNRFGQSFQSSKDKISNIKQEYIKFNNSLNNLSSSKQPNICNQNQAINNIYTTKQVKQDKRSILSRSSKSNKSSKSKGKLQKASSLGFGVQKVKSSNIIGVYSDELNYKNSQNKVISQNNKKPNLINFDDSSHVLKNRNLQSPKNNTSMQSDNHPYKDQNSQSHHSNSNRNQSNTESASLNRKILKNQEIIFVEQTIRKPKFGFVKQEFNDQQTYLKSPKKQKNKSDQNIIAITNQSLESIKVDPQLYSQDKISKYSSIPSDFNAVFGKRHKKQNDSQNDSELGIKLNKYPHKVKQLQMQIQKAKQYQRLYQQRMRQKDEQYQILKKNLPQGHQKVHQQNKKLKDQLQQKQKKEADRLLKKQQKLYKSPNNKVKIGQQIPFLPNKIFSLGKIKPFNSSFIKQLISNKCLLQKNQIFELGYAFKKQKQDNLQQRIDSFSICLYFKFKVKCQKLDFKLINESLILKDYFQAKVLNIAANKQLKFQQKIIGYTLKNQQFKIPTLSLQIKLQQQILNQLNSIRIKQKQAVLKQKYQIIIPCSLFNFLDFHTPTQKIQLIKTKYAIQSQFLTQQYLNSLKGQYLINSFKCGKWYQKDQKQEGFYISFYSYVKSIKDRKILKGKQTKILFDQFNYLQKKSINLYIRKLNSHMFYIESDNQFQNDKIALIQITKILAR